MKETLGKDGSGRQALEDEILGRVLYRDALMLVIDKPAGIPVHRGPKAATYDGPALDAAFEALRFGLPQPPALAHRLDRDTSGCLVLGRHRQALERLRQLFVGNSVGKTYWAIVEGVPEGEEGTIDLPLGRKDPSRGWWMKVDENGLPSKTHWKVLGRNGEKAWLELTPITGRTHQLRVHCAAMGWPIAGDSVYGKGQRFGGPMLNLHARAITLPLYPKKPPISVEAPAPEHMRQALTELGWREELPA